MPEKSTRVFLPQLGIEGYINPKSNTLSLYPEDFLKGTAKLPADQQHPFYVEEKEVFGEENNETTIAKLEIFTELAKRYPKVFTHVTHSNSLPTILSSGFIGRPYEKGYKGIIQSERGGVFAETLIFKDSSEYAKAISQLKSANEITIPEDIPQNDKSSNYPLHELVYVELKSINPIAIFSDKFSQKHNLEGWLANDVADIKDDCLVGIWVTPQYRQHLLHWISTWSDEKRQEVFGERKPEEVLISSAQDLPPLEK